jgi:hypothetical protein
MLDNRPCKLDFTEFPTVDKELVKEDLHVLVKIQIKFFRHHAVKNKLECFALPSCLL